MPIILENDAILHHGRVIRYVPRGDAFALLRRVFSVQTLFSGIRDLFSSVSLEDTRPRVTPAFALFARMRLLRPYTPHSCDREYQIRDSTFQKRASFSSPFQRFVNDVQLNNRQITFWISRLNIPMFTYVQFDFIMKSNIIVSLNSNITRVLF